MSWVLGSLVSAFLLGCYELLTKHAVRGNAVLLVLFWSNVCSAAIWLLLLGVPSVFPHLLPSCFLVPRLTPGQHGLLVLKTALVASSWILTFYGVKYLPVSITSPVRSTGPIWTLFGAVLVLGERPTGLQNLGIVTACFGLVALSLAGKMEGVDFRRNRWVWLIFGGTLLGSVSALYDQYLFHTVGFSAATVQAWFSIYLALFFLPLALGQLRWPSDGALRWRWSIPLLSVALLSADFVYFTALQRPDALISVVTSLRRVSMLVGFAGGLLLFRETSNARKWMGALGVLA